MLPHSPALSLVVRRRAASEAQAVRQEAAACQCPATARARWQAACRAYEVAHRRAGFTRNVTERYGPHYARAFGIWRRTEARIPYLSTSCTAWCRALSRLSLPSPEVAAAFASPLALLAYAQRHAAPVAA